MTIRTSSPIHIRVINKCPELITDAEATWITAAVAAQTREHFCPAWGLAPIEVAVYKEGVAMVPYTLVIYLVKTDGNPDSLGYHTEVGALGIGFVDVNQTLSYQGINLADRQAVCDAICRILSHEVLEGALNLDLDSWVHRAADGLDYANEACDPVEAVAYPVQVTLFGDTRSYRVSDFITPAYFDESAPVGDYLGQAKPFEILPGGYQITRDSTGRIDFGGDAEKAQAKAARLLSRVMRHTVHTVPA
jgi:hypothetical protein